MTLNTGQVLNNRYRVVKLLAQGGMGAVYRAWDLNLRMAVALKENLEMAPIAIRQFEHEATILAALHHPNLPRVIDYFSIMGQGQYLVMDFIEGEDLQAMIDSQGTLPEEQVVDWITQVCRALEYLHSQPAPIIHRDIKPANIKIRPDGRAILVDFGIAKIYDPSRSTTMGAKAVTPGFSPPEQYSGMTDARSDIYALGATLYNVLTGELPPESALRAVSSLALTPPCQLNPAISPGVEAAILTATKIPTEQRFQRVSELRMALLQPSQTILAHTQQAATIAAVPQTMLAPLPPPPQYIPPRAVAPAANLPKKAPSLAWLPILAGIALVAILVTGGFIFLLPRLAATATSQPATLVVIQPPVTDTRQPAPPPSATTAPSTPPPPAPSPTRTKTQPRPNATATPPPSPTRVPASPTPAGPLMLLMDNGYNCRGGPSGSYELIWTFEEGMLKEIIGRTSDNSWWLVRIDDSRTRRQQCWVGGGIPQGDTSLVPISNWTGTVDTAKTPWP